MKPTAKTKIEFLLKVFGGVGTFFQKGPNPPEAKVRVNLGYIMVLLIIFTLNSFPRIIGNRGNVIFIQTVQNDSAVRGAISEAAGYFLNSNSEFQALLNRIELVDIKGSNYNEWRQICANAVVNIEKSAAKYLILKQMLENIPYHQGMIDRLQTFDYDGYQEKNHLNPFLFAEVKAYLGSGNVRGIFDRMLTSTTKILDSLTSIKTAIDSGNMPELAMLWRLNQDYMEALLFGQYAAEVFYAIE